MAITLKLHSYLLVSFFAASVMAKNCQDQHCGLATEDGEEQSLLQSHKKVVQMHTRLKFPTESEDTCFPDSTDVHIDGAETVYNNLGGQGPEMNQPEVMRFKNIATTPAGLKVDLVIESLGNYTPFDSAENGLNNDFIQVNVMAGTQAELKVSFVDSSITESLSYVKLERFEMTIYDIDHKKKITEMVTVDEYRHYFVVPDFEFGIENLDVGGTVFTSTHVGKECDNPDRRHNDLGEACGGVNIAKRAVLFEFEATSGFKLKYEVLGSKVGRNFFLSGGARALCPSPICQNYCSEKSEADHKCMHAGCAACDECRDDEEDIDIQKFTPDDNETVIETTPQNCGPESARTRLNLADVVTNNLGGQGPEDEQPKMIRVRNAGMTPEGKSLDLVIIEEGGNYEPKNNEMNGLYADFIQINLAQEHVAELDIRFVDSSVTDSLSYVTLAAFEMTVYDIDQGSTGGQESYTMHNYDSYYTVPGYEFNISDPNDGSGASFVSTHFGNMCDNPTDYLDMGEVVCADIKGKNEMSILKRARSVQFNFKNTSGFKLTFKVSGNWNGKKAKGGRNMMLGGATPTLCLPMEPPLEVLMPMEERPMQDRRGPPM